MQPKSAQNPPEFRTIGKLAAKAALDMANGILKTTGKDPLKPHQRRELLAQAGGKNG